MANLNLAEILRHKGKSYLLSHLDKEKITLSEIEHLIIDARIGDYAIISIQDEGVVKKKAGDLISRVSAQCGCAVPGTQFFLNIITEELVNFLMNFNKGKLSYEEYLLAFRINSVGGYKFPSSLELERIPFTGVCFNIEYFAKVVDNYFKIRNQLDRKLQNFIDGYKQ